MDNATKPENEYERHRREPATTDPEDVLLDVPTLHIDSLELEVADLRARVSLQAEVLNLLRLNVGIDADLGKASLDLRGVEAKALLKVRLENVVSVLDRVLQTLDSHPEIVEALARHAALSAKLVGDVGEGLERAIRPIGQETTRAAQQVAKNAIGTAQPLTRMGGAPTPGVEHGRDEPEVEACATVSAENRGDGEEKKDKDGKQGKENGEDKAGGGEGRNGERRYRGLPRRIRRRW